MKLRSFRLLSFALPILLLGCSSDNNNGPLPPPATWPVAQAGEDQTVAEGSVVTLQGSASAGTATQYVWSQVSGPEVDFTVSPTGELKFVAPDVLAQTTLEFDLVIVDERQTASAPDRVVVTVNQQKFFGTAPGGPEDYEHLVTYFNQITPENAGKWGSVEATRDVMDWTALDTAHQTAVDNGFEFKYHVLLWGQQQPGWIASLPAEEQLAEIEEWMAAVAARYPDLDLVEVVNEPMNAPPSYRDALGGAGETGYDWIITAFEMAREHFPNAQLILNEYNVIVDDGLTTNYLNIIGLLQERGLIDGIGEQAHFYERANPEVLAANLDRLAATGLPIYISEFDLNLADDADQANVMSRLFPIFWDHPRVAGVTHWGHLQGSVWRTNAYLIRTDGTTRPALDWLMCYIGGGGDTCTVPEYVHPGWHGDEFGLTLEAVMNDQNQGVVSGGTIAYTDDGDWIMFKGVEFDSGWDTIWVNYAKGNTDEGSISIHLDSLDNDAAATVELPPTSGWGSAATVEDVWTPIVGTHDVYVRFNGTSGVGNLNNVRFGKPIPPSTVNLVTDGGFETGAAGWNNWGGNGTLSASTLQAHAGTQSLQSTGRSGTGGYAAYNLTSVVQRNTTYAVTAWALHTGAANDTVRLAAKVECTPATAPSGHNTYPWLQNNSAVAPNTWTQLSGNLVIPDCDIVDVAIYFEGTATGVDVYLDDVSVTPPADANLVTDGGFETGIAGWDNWGNGDLSASTAQAHDGAQSLLSINRSGTGGFAAYNLTSVVSAGNSYAVSAWVYVDGTTARLARKLRCGGADSYSWLDNNTAVAPNTWTQLSGTLDIPADCALEEATIYFENVPTGVDAYIDDVSVNGS